MLLNSPYPDPPPFPEVNAYHLFLGRPDQAAWDDYTLHIDVVNGEKRSFRDYVKRVHDVTTALGAPVLQGGLGLHGQEGEIVGILSENSMDYSTLVHSCLALATPFAPISSYSTPFELKHALPTLNATRLFIHAKHLPVALPVAKEVGFPLDKIYLMGGNAAGYRSLSDMIEQVRIKNIPAVAVRTVTKDTLAYLMFSSGTSGLPKAVMISHGNIIYSISQAAVLAQAMDAVYTPPPPKNPEGIPVSLTILPMHHSYGLHMFCFRTFLSPVTLVVTAKWDIDVALQAIPKYKVSILTLIPSIIHQLVNHPKVQEMDLSSLDFVGSGAAYLPPDIAKKITSLIPQSANFTDGYGMSEATISAIVQPFPGTLEGRLNRVAGSVGVLLPGVQARIIRDDGSDADFEEPGELLLKGSMVALGYWNNEKANKEAFINGWLHTGDKFSIDRKGNFYFADRAKDTLKISGAQVSPVEIENVLLAHPKDVIIDVTVAGVSGGRTADEKVPRAWVVLSEMGKELGAEAVKQELETWCQKNLSRYKWLRGGIEVVNEIPKSPTGKTLRRVLQDKYEKENSSTVKGKL